jgi:hypothetical protein
VGRDSRQVESLVRRNQPLQDRVPRRAAPGGVPKIRTRTGDGIAGACRGWTLRALPRHVKESTTMPLVRVHDCAVTFEATSTS